MTPIITLSMVLFLVLICLIVLVSYTLGYLKGNTSKEEVLLEYYKQGYFKALDSVQEQLDKDMREHNEQLNQTKEKNDE